MPPLTASAVFDAVAQSYDAARRKLIPCFDGFYGTVADLIRDHSPSAPRILDLGAGTGLLSAMALSVRPHADLVLTDVAEAMLAKAAERFARGVASVELRVMDHLELSDVGCFDVVMSALSIHHLEDEGKRQVYARAIRALKPGGLFVNADQVAGDTDVMEQRYWKHWNSAAVAAGITSSELAAAIERQKLDRRTPLAPQLAWLAEAGLSEVECRYKNVSFAVLCGFKPR